MKTLHYIGLLLLIITLSSWGTKKDVKGSGKIRKEQKEVAYFEGINVSSAIHVYLKQGDVQTVEIEGDDNIVPFIQAKVRDQVLYLSLEGPSNVNNFSPVLPMNVYVTLKKLREIEANAASKVEGQSVFTVEKLELDITSAANLNLKVEGESIEMEVSAAAKATLEGNINNLEVDLSGASKLDASDLQALKADIETSGASSATLNVKDELQYDVSGASKLTYTGHPRIYKAEVSAAGKVNQK